MTLQKAVMVQAEASHDHCPEPPNAAPHDDHVDDKLSSDISSPMTATFPEKLMYILDNEDIYGDTASWLPDGRSFTIRNPRRFSEEVLPHFFSRGCRFDSFMRKLYYWGFKKAKSKGQGAEVTFHHKNFCRGSAPSCMHLRTLQKSYQKKYFKSITANKMNGNASERDISSSSDEAESSMLDANNANIARMVKEAIDIHDQQIKMKVVQKAKRGQAEYLLMTKQVQYQRPLDTTSLSCLQQVTNILSQPIERRTPQLHLKVPHQLGNAFQGRNDQRSYFNTSPLMPFYHLDGKILTTNASLLPVMMLQGGNAASMLPGANVMS
eukprot:CAMPEP_0185739990 /NCGR_PEP_ID=MMETSP1171-20130828/36714_1 /TAXON_ID=374046 /ORGANISM="Helicotheca tamensis, Strain CCMP826" /LENGTH=322 /DNA_ID=CAMNT_0028411715 /DNA_START=15 /DNA_END=980 /DNA_ORIENTATION=+